MKNKIFDLIKLSEDDKSDGQGFVLVGNPISGNSEEENIKKYSTEQNNAENSGTENNKVEDNSTENNSTENNSTVNNNSDQNRKVNNDSFKEPNYEHKPDYNRQYKSEYQYNNENKIDDDLKDSTFKQDTPKTPPYTEKMTGTDDNFFSQFNSGDKAPGIENDPYRSSNSANRETEKKKSPAGRNALILILALIIGLGGGIGGGYLAVQNFGSLGSGKNITINPSSDTEVTEAVAAKVLPSVVGITATTTTVSQDMFFGPQQQESSGVGTGIIIDKSGYILTNSHVIMDDDKSKLTVLLASGDEVSGTVEWFDATLDLAIVKISASNLTAAELGDSDKINIGQYAAAIGNPLGLEFQGSVTSGVVSGLNRTITASSGSKEVQMEELIQVDAAINSGNSGGPLLNSKGEVIGINTAKAESGEGMGFAIPINVAKPIVKKIIETGEFNRVYMGVSVRDAASIIEEYPNIDLGTKSGAYIVQVTNGSPAEAAGLKEKDVIVEVDGKKIESRTELINLLLNYSSGDTISVKYYRDGKVATAKVKLTGDVPAE